VNGFDWIIIAVILLSALAAAAHGFLTEVFSLAGTILGFILAAWQYWRIAPFYEPYVRSPQLANAAGFLTIVLIISLLAAIAGKISRWAMKEVGLRWADRMLGGAFGLVRGLVMATVLVLVATSFVPDAYWLQRSVLANHLSVSARVAAWAAPESVRSRFLDGVAYLRKARQDALAKIDKTPAAPQRHD
jgi:membrane protein required for colicin V production